MTKAQSWQMELQNFISVKSLFMIEGNVDDIYPIYDSERSYSDVDETLSFDDFDAVLEKSFSSRGYHLIFCDPLRGLRGATSQEDTSSIIEEAANIARGFNSSVKNANPSIDAKCADDSMPFALNRLVENSMIIRAAITNKLESAGDKPIACILNMANRIAINSQDLTPEENAVYMNLLLAVRDAIRPDGVNMNTVVTVSDRAASLPIWFYQGNPSHRIISVPTPDRSIREEFVDYAFAADNRISKKGLEKFVDTTDSMKLLELDEIRRLFFFAKDVDTPVDDAASSLCNLVEMYKYGIRENRWDEVSEKLKEGPLKVLKQRVMGQDRALERIVTVLKRSVMGLSGMQHSSPGKPKGVLFLAGPTGTGKTEVVKAVTELLFGDERSYKRFDMSEYSSENADQKLFGAPPGYVGYDQGGQLTNAVRENPFTVLLFDEIEKAHPSIMDKFLQILEDGRMTDGRGNTVYFGETLIFFTSNAGISEEVKDAYGNVIERRAVILPGESYEVMNRKVIDALSIYFKPEVMGRIGNNIVVFDYISDDAARLIARSQIERINKGIKSRFNVSISVSESAFEILFQWSREPEVIEKGGRGIGNLIESEYLNPLSSFMFDNSIKSEDSLEVYACNDNALKFKRI